jgi:hypothetical protein
MASLAMIDVGAAAGRPIMALVSLDKNKRTV